MAVSQYAYRYFLIISLLVLTIVLALASCSIPNPQPAAKTDIPAAATATDQSSPTVPLVSSTSTATPTVPTPTPFHTSTPRPIPTRTPSPIAAFQTKLPADVSAVGYIANDCQVIQNRWSSQNSAPGTIVVPVMIHSIARPGRPVTDNSTITEEYYLRFIEQAHQMGFQTITSEQLVGFLQNNEKIPPAFVDVDRG